jgi:hypothetical protein
VITRASTDEKADSQVQAVEEKELSTRKDQWSAPPIYTVNRHSRVIVDSMNLHSILHVTFPCREQFNAIAVKDSILNRAPRCRTGRYRYARHACQVNTSRPSLKRSSKT